MNLYTVTYQAFEQRYVITSIFGGHQDELSGRTRTLHLLAINPDDAYKEASKILAGKAQRKAEEV